MISRRVLAELKNRRDTSRDWETKPDAFEQALAAVVEACEKHRDTRMGNEEIVASTAIYDALTTLELALEAVEHPSGGDE